MDMLVQKVSRGDPSATLLAKQLGPAVAPLLKPLATDEDPVVREIALHCLELSGSTDIVEVFAAALLDESPSVRMAALSGLNSFIDPAVYPKLLSAYDKSDDAVTRKEIALLIGRLHNARRKELEHRCLREKAAEAREGCITALAKLGDRAAQNEFVQRLHAAKDRDRKRFLDYVEYIQQTWVLPALLPVLDDKSPMIRIGVDGIPPGTIPEYLRACDIAINLIARIGGASFSFAVNRGTNYSDEQIKEARHVLISLMP